MRPYRNVSDAELDRLEATREWNQEVLLNLTLPSKILWVHANKEKFHRLDTEDSCVVRTLTILQIRGNVIKTDFGSYSLESGKNLFDPCGCKKFCDCYGQLYLFKRDIASLKRHFA